MEECPHLRLFKEAYLIASTLYSQRRQLRDLWKVLAGSASQYTDAIMLTLGTGVGGGIIITREDFIPDPIIWERNSDIPNWYTMANAARRKGCLEAYCSSTALIRIMKETFTKNKDTLIMETLRRRRK